VQPHTEINDIFSAEDWVQTLAAAAGEPDIANKLLQGYSAAGKTFKVHLDGYDQRDLLAGKGPDKRREFFYWTDDGDLSESATINTKSSLWNSKHTAWRFGCSHSCLCSHPSCSVCARIRSNARKSNPATM
jgi:hypothetical protein